MKALRKFLIASLYVAVLVTNAASAASTTNYSDEWWIQSESGWGVTVQQQGDLLFVQLSVYGTDNQATWLTTSAVRQTTGASGHDMFVGELSRPTVRTMEKRGMRRRLATARWVSLRLTRRNPMPRR